MSTKLAVIYYSSTGTIDAMARRMAATAEAAGAEVRLRHVAELAPREAIDSNPAWRAHADAVAEEPIAVVDDIVWADAVLLGTPTRFGNVASQLKQYLDSLSGPWSQGLLADKAYAAFTSSQTSHGGQETTLTALYNTVIHFGGVVVAPGYTDGSKFVDGNPYGVSHITGGSNDAPLTDTETTALDHMVTRVIRIAAKLAA